MRLLRRFPLLAFSLVLISIIGVCIAQGNVTLLLVAGVLAAASWYVTEGPRGRSLPRWVSNIIVLGITMYVLLELVQRGSDNALPLLGQFVTLLTVVKLYERKTPRDYASLLSLSLLLMLTGCLQSSDLLFGIVLFVYIILGLYVLLLFQLYAAYEDTRREREAATPTEARFVMPLRPAFGRHEGLHFRALAVAVAVVGFVVSTAVFFLVPRNVGVGVIPRVPGQQGVERQSGFAAGIDLVTGDRITTSKRSVMSLTVRDAKGNPTRLDRPILLRGAALSEYKAGTGRWAPRSGGSERLKVRGDPAMLLANVATDGGTRYELEMQLYDRHDALFAFGQPLSLHTDTNTQIAFDRLTQTMRVADGASVPGTYTVRVHTAPADDAASRSSVFAPPIVIGSTVRDSVRFTRVPPQIANLTEDVLRGAGITPRPRYSARRDAAWNRAVARAIVDYLRSPPFVYTLDLSDVVRRVDASGRPQDPTVQFLFETKRGHCEYFASAMALMCRSVDVPARVTTGYVAYNYNQRERAYEIMQANAHAWVEVRTSRGRWETFDPTPPADFDQHHNVPINTGNRLRAFYDDIERGWTNNFVRFDRQSQTEMVQSLEGTWSQRLRRFGQTAREWARRVNRAFYFGPAGYIWMGLVGVVVIIALIAAVKYGRRAWRLRQVLALDDVQRPSRRRMRRQLAFYLDMLTVLERGGLAKPDWQPPHLFAQSLASNQIGDAMPIPHTTQDSDRPKAEKSSISEIVRELTDLFYAGRYGNQRLDERQTRRAQNMLRELAEQLKVRL